MIKSVKIKNFMGYGEFECSEFAAINVLIGKNDTGKTGILKLFYAIIKSIDIYGRRKKSESVSFKKLFAEKMMDTFQPGKKGLGELVNKLANEKMAVNIEFDHKKLDYQAKLKFSFGDSTTNTIVDCPDNMTSISDSFRCLFIPAKEVLTSLKAIRATRDNLHMPGFDDTYLDLIRALVIPVHESPLAPELIKVNKKMSKLFEGQIEQQSDDDFLFKKGGAEYTMPLTAEGIKKLGVLSTLIGNDQLNSNSVLFMDEPETTLHPEATRELVEMLMIMAKAGIQIFITTHNYFVLKQLYLCARSEKISTYCFALNREKGKSISVSKFDLMDSFPENQISDEAIRMADDEVKMDLGF